MLGRQRLSGEPMVEAAAQPPAGWTVIMRVDRRGDRVEVSTTSTRATGRKSMSKASSREQRDDLIERAKRIAGALGMHWDGLGGAHQEQLGDERSVWRVHDEWMGTGGAAVFDAASDELLSIEATPPERDPPAPPLPERLVPRDEDLVAFAQQRLAAIGWELPEHVSVTRDDAAKAWRVEASAMSGGPRVDCRFQA